MKFGACGFNNNNISVYSNPTLSNTGWRIETKDAVPRATRPVGEYWQPCVVCPPPRAPAVLAAF